jgi:UDP-3-O-[3-hydroxymyristoyl] glucosamine N-acyltransferase
VAEGVSIGPFAVIEAGARIGAGSRIGAHAYVGKGAAVGQGCVLHPQSTLYAGVVLGDRCIIHSGARIGKEGFGFVWIDGGHRKLPQVGGCVLGNDVEVGCNTTIDRGSIGDTVVGDGTKIDNLVQLGHNDRIGRHVILVSQVGISGSTTVGDGAVLAGQVGVGGHLSIGAGAKIGGQAGVIGDVPAGETYSGYPARPHREAMRSSGLVARLGDLFRRVRAIERRLEAGDDRPDVTNT